MSTETNTYFATYRGYVNLYVPFQAESQEAAEDILRNDLPRTPAKDQDFLMATSDFDFELDDYMVEESEVTFTKVPTPLSKAVIKSAVTQSEIRAEQQKQFQIDKLSKQIEDAQAQLLTATKGITDQIDSLNKQLAELKG